MGGTDRAAGCADGKFPPTPEDSFLRSPRPKTVNFAGVTGGNEQENVVLASHGKGTGENQREKGQNLFELFDVSSFGSESDDN